MAGIFDGIDAKAIAEAISPRSPQDPFYAELGRFIVDFSLSEFNVRHGLRELVGTTAEETAALFHKWSLSECTEGINRILAARDDHATAARLGETFKQLQAIAEVRNALVHWRAKLDLQDGFVVVNTHRAHYPAKLVEYRVGFSQLENMRDDLIRINLLVAYGIAYKKLPRKIKTDIEQQILPVPWQYTRPQQG